MLETIDFSLFKFYLWIVRDYVKNETEDTAAMFEI